MLATAAGSRNRVMRRMAREHPSVRPGGGHGGDNRDACFRPRRAPPGWATPSRRFAGCPPSFPTCSSRRPAARGRPPHGQTRPPWADGRQHPTNTSPIGRGPSASDKHVPHRPRTVSIRKTRPPSAEDRQHPTNASSGLRAVYGPAPHRGNSPGVYAGGMLAAPASSEARSRAFFPTGLSLCATNRTEKSRGTCPTSRFRPKKGRMPSTEAPDRRSHAGPAVDSVSS